MEMRVNEMRQTDIWDDTVEGATGIAETMLAGRKLAEVARGPGYEVVVESEDDTADAFLVHCDIKLGSACAFSVGWFLLFWRKYAQIH